MKNLIGLILATYLVSVCMSQAWAMSVPEARIWGQADDGYYTFDHTELYSNTASLYHEYPGAQCGYANHSFGGNTPSLGASAYAMSNGTTTNFSVLTVPYQYFAWRVVRNVGVSDSATSIPVDLNIVYSLDSSITGVGHVSNNAFFNDGCFGYLWFAPTATPSYPYTPGTYDFHHNAFVNEWNTTYMQLSAGAANGNLGGAAEIEAAFSAALSVSSAWDDRYHIEMNIVPAPVPVPSAILLFGSGLLGIAGIRKKMKD